MKFRVPDVFQAVFPGESPLPEKDGEQHSERFRAVLSFTLCDVYMACVAGVTVLLARTDQAAISI